MAMLKVHVEESGAGVASLVGQLERDGDLLIIRDGRPVALLQSLPQPLPEHGFRRLLAFRSRLAREGAVPVSASDIRALIDEGRKH